MAIGRGPTLKPSETNTISPFGRRTTRGIALQSLVFKSSNLFLSSSIYFHGVLSTIKSKSVAEDSLKFLTCPPQKLQSSIHCRLFLIPLTLPLILLIVNSIGGFNLSSYGPHGPSPTRKPTYSSSFLKKLHFSSLMRRFCSTNMSKNPDSSCDWLWWGGVTRR